MKWFTLLAIANIYADSLTPALSDTEAKKDPQATPYYPYSNRVALFNPFHQTYERIKSDAFYVGIEAWLTLVVLEGNYELNFFPVGLIGEAELRMGYNYLFGAKDHFTPFLGAGIFNDWTKEKHHEIEINSGIAHYTIYKKSRLPPVVYGTFGFLYNHEFTNYFTLGLHLKGLIGAPTQNKHWGSPVIGADIALPLTFRFGPSRHWDFRMEPFNIYLHGQNVHRDYLGFRNTLGYRF